MRLEIFACETEKTALTITETQNESFRYADMKHLWATRTKKIIWVLFSLRHKYIPMSHAFLIQANGPGL